MGGYGVDDGIFFKIQGKHSALACADGGMDGGIEGRALWNDAMFEQDGGIRTGEAGALGGKRILSDLALRE